MQPYRLVKAAVHTRGVATWFLFLACSAQLQGQDAAPGALDSQSSIIRTNRPSNSERPLPSNPLDWLPRWFSPEIRRLDQERERIEKEISRLPRPMAGQNGGTLGYHSRIGGNRKWVQIDLGKRQLVNAVAMVPAHAEFGDGPGSGYGFPLRYRIDISDDPAFMVFDTIADHTDEDVENPGDSPVFHVANGFTGRFIRVTATKLWFKKDNPLFALGELFVLQGVRNIAANCPVTAADTIENPPRWALSYLVDNQSILGLPVDASKPSRSNGWHSEEFEKDPYVEKWVQVDLGQTVPIDQISLFPARPINFADIIGFGFPVRFRIDVSEDPSFSVKECYADFSKADFPNPGNNPVVVSAPDMGGRFVRVTSTRLWERTKDYAFALSELQVHSGDTNVASGALVTAFESHEGDEWSARYLVDGFSSQFQLITQPEWLNGLALRRDFNAQLRQLELSRRREMDKILRRLAQWGGAGVAIVLLFLGFLSYRYRIHRLRELDRLRNRIASDLHDELGASLTQIGMLGELAKRDLSNPSAVEVHADKIATRAREAVRALDEVVWTVNPKNDTLSHLVGYLLQYAEQFFDQTPIRCRLDGPTEIPESRLSTDIRHNLLMAFKEALNNVLKHSLATEVWIRISLNGTTMSMSVEDNGVGGASGSPRGNGLNNMRDRMAEIGGQFQAQPRKPQGTCVELLVPISRNE